MHDPLLYFFWAKSNGFSFFKTRSYYRENVFSLWRVKNVKSGHSAMHDSKMLPCCQIKCPLLQNNKNLQEWKLLFYGLGTFSIVSFVSGCAEERSFLKVKGSIGISPFPTSAFLVSF